MNVEKHKQAGASRELTVYFNGAEEKDRKARAYAYAQGLAMKEFDVSRGELNINELLNAMRNSRLTVPELLDEKKLKSRFGSGLEDFNQEDLIVMIKKDQAF